MSASPETRRDREWRSDAACLDVDPDVFFPAAEFGPAYEDSVARARSICARCPVRAACLDFALVALPCGIAAGLTQDERRRMRGQDARPFLSSWASQLRSEGGLLVGLGRSTADSTNAGQRGLGFEAAG
jgi:hypothetical protein